MKFIKRQCAICGGRVKHALLFGGIKCPMSK